MSHRPRKRFGQHFLHDPAVIARIVDAIDPHPGQDMVEIGPGLGAITFPLLERLGRLRVIELDRDAAAALRRKAGPESGLEIIEADALTVDISRLAGHGQIRVAGNLPYNISTPLLFHLLGHLGHIRDMHFMLQKEVVTRMAAQPGGREYGRLTVMLALRCRTERLFDVGTGAFSPPPRVNSSFVRLLPDDALWRSVHRPDFLAQLVRSAFSARRKTLRNSLKGLVTASQFAAAGIDPGVRAETLTPEEFVRLANAVQD